MTATFPSIVSSPPGGMWFWGDGATFIAEPDLAVLEGKVGAELRRRGDPTPARDAIVAHMCPRMPRGWCVGYSGPQIEPSSARIARARTLASMPVERVDVIVERMERCASCPKCTHPDCVTCRGIDGAVYSIFGGLRPKLPQDRSSGTCSCAKTYVMAIASVAYPEGADTWEGTPPECWRNDR